MAFLIQKTNPKQIIGVELTLIDPAHHGDPGQSDGSNSSPYRRQLMRLPQTVVGRTITQAELDTLCRLYPLPESLTQVMEGESPATFVAIIITKFFIERYAHGEGEGLFSGVERYTRLESRFKQVATRTNSIKDFWDEVCHALNVPSVSGDKAIDELIRFYSLPKPFAALVLDEIAKHTQFIRVTAQEWHKELKWLKKNYDMDADSSSSAAIPPLKFVTLAFGDLAESTLTHRDLSVSVVHHSGNDIRHDLRMASGLNMLQLIGDAIDGANNTFIGDTNILTNEGLGKFYYSLPKSVMALLENGGAIASGAKEADNSYALMQDIKAMYPLWGLLGGVTSTFILGAGNLESVSAHYVCRENNRATQEFGITVNHSMADILDTWGLTRHAVRSDNSPMPLSFETVQAGAKLIVRLQLSPFTTRLEYGVLASTLLHLNQSGWLIGGKAARGFGRVSATLLQADEDLLESTSHEYQTYLQANAEKLKSGLMDGTLGTKIKVCL